MKERDAHFLFRLYRHLKQHEYFVSNKGFIVVGECFISIESSQLKTSMENLVSVESDFWEKY